MKNKVIIISPGAGGKDYLKKRLIDRGFKPSVSYTTRPPREGEVEGVSYRFVSEETFARMIEEGLFREYNCFGPQKWYYGTTVQNFEESTLFIMTPSALEAMTPVERSQCIVLYLDIPEEVRRQRLLERNDADDPNRRLETDRELFKDFTNYDARITDPFFTVGDILDIIQDFKYV